MRVLSKLIWISGVIMPLIMLICAFILVRQGHCQNALPKLQADSLESLFEKIKLAKQELAGKTIRHSAGVARYEEVLKQPNGLSIKVDEDFEWKEVHFKLYDFQTGSISDAAIRKFIGDLERIKSGGPKLLYYDGYVFEMEGRPAGPLWNAFNTPLRVVRPQNTAVLANKYLVYLHRTKEIKEIIYAPYSSVWHRPEIIAAGRRHLRDDISRAVGEIQKLKPAGANLPIFDKGDRWLMGAMERLILIEHSDPYEVMEFGRGGTGPNPFDRIYAVIFLNGEDAYTQTVSKASARGIVQFTKATWENTVRKKHSWALLPPFEEGTLDHTRSVMASILLHNDNAEKLIEAFGNEVMTRWREPEHYLAAAYNTGVGRIIRALRRHKRSGAKRWRHALPYRETQYMLKKLDVAIEHGYGN